MSDDEGPVESFFSKRAKLAPKKSPEELRAAAELLNKLESEKNMPIVAEAESVCKKGRKKKIPSEPAGTESDLMADLDGTKLSAAARRRLKKFKVDQELDLAELDAKNAKILSTKITDEDILNVPEEPDIPEEKVIHLTVNCLSKVARFKCLENDNFVKVFQDVAEFFELKPSEFLLCLNERNIVISDTPKDLSLSELDILECIPYKNDETSENLDDENNLLISFQSNDMKTKIDMIVNKMEKFTSIMERYSKERKLPLNELTFRFDGDKLTGEETPEELEMDNQNCIDVTVCAPVAHSSRSSQHSPVAGCSYADDMSTPSCSYTAANDGPSYLQDFLIVESDSNDSDIVALD